MGEKAGVFKGGVHPFYRKEATAAAAIAALDPPVRVILPLQQHIGAPCSPLVKAGDEVKVGTVIGQAEGFVSAPVHATISGKVKSVGPQPHPMGVPVPAVVIESDGSDLREEGRGLDPETLSADDLRNLVRESGIVGLGGATFPTHVKLSPPAEKPIDTLILNGAECEPYLTADHRLMVERAADIVEGSRILAKILGVEKILFGVEANKPDAADALRGCLSGDGMSVVSLPVKYPQGAEKQLIKAILGREVPPPPGLPMDVGVVVQNVGTALSVKEAIRDGKPLVERVVTVTGSGINRPSNLLVRLGTPLVTLAEACGGVKEGVERVIMGGPMMGLAQSTLEVPVVKGTSGLLFLRSEDLGLSGERPCIRCGRCVRACPMIISPQTIALYARSKLFEKAEKWRALDCIECGCCSFSCPSSIPLVHYIRYAKGQIVAARRKQKQKEEATAGA
ncbi:electron transport complex subunit RsxC [bacterium]|nr:electron transport complex subunit RsxC [bacterium]